ASPPPAPTRARWCRSSIEAPTARSTIRREGTQMPHPRVSATLTPPSDQANCIEELNMPELRRAGKPTLHYALDDYTHPSRDAPHLILQHGYGPSGRFWYCWVPYLSRFYKVVRPDLRGLGQSEVPADLETSLTVEAYIDDLLAIIDALGGPVHYCGES